jgi:hypothetical protein
MNIKRLPQEGELLESQVKLLTSGMGMYQLAGEIHIGDEKVCDTIFAVIRKENE